ncbi:biliverdin-producing heme oxygenase [Thalassobaculum sp. OXR-137]|uniref:biliverdin-producing heme oxygenase n=1 Tax=Thalassobaculum sp. OXR-137 TaxID=3100173 RepID=UPI002AC9B8A9|nr:biliverdin-producing heme oxygenase [Thalassobaculum sp. OXR-137]WPZ33952.1 biliverdin-producing heme oxygenase [Thalassobaculum sp. OXR-137]
MRLRDHLRRETRALHQRTEALLQHLDIRTRAGLDSFLLVHHAVVMPMERRLAASDMTRRWPFRLTDLLVEDLEERALKPTAGVPAARFEDADPVGLSYVLGGSRLGSRVLLKRLAGACPAPRYLSRAPDDEIWPWTLSLLNSPEAAAAPREDVLQGAEIAFASFADAVSLVEAPKETIHALAV